MGASKNIPLWCDNRRSRSRHSQIVQFPASDLHFVCKREFFEAPIYRLARRAHPPDVEITDSLAQGIPVQPQKFGGLDLIAVRRGESRRNQRIFDLPQDPVIESGWRQARAVLMEKLGEMPLHRAGKRRAPLG